MLCEIKLSCECFNTSVTIEGSYLSVWQPVRVQIGNSVAVLVALVAFFRLLAHVRPYLIFVIIFTLAKFLENKIYTEKRQFFALNL